MSALEDYLRRRGTSPLTQALGTDDAKFKNLLRTVNTYNTNRVGGQVLSLAGADIDPSGLTAQQRPGVLSTTSKALNAPRAGLFRVLGMDPELTGKDVFRSSSGDNLLKKAAKTVGGFAFGDSGCHHQPTVWLWHGCFGHRRPCHTCRRSGFDDRGRGREHEPRSFCDAQSRGGVWPQSANF